MVTQSSATVPGGGLPPFKNNLVFILFVTIMKAIFTGCSPYIHFKWEFKFPTSRVHTVLISPSPTPSLYITIRCGRAPPLKSLYFCRASEKKKVFVRLWKFKNLKIKFQPHCTSNTVEVLCHWYNFYYSNSDLIYRHCINFSKILWT